MGIYRKFSAEERWRVIAPIIDKKHSINSVAKKNKIKPTVINVWVRKYKESGWAGLENRKSWKKYTKELKIRAVEDVIIRGLSRHEVTRKYEISSRSVLLEWIKRYNSEKELKDTSSGRVGTIMTKARKTTLEERIEITQYTIARNLDYKSAMEKYDVSYQQVYSWVNKYKVGGPEALKDNRGRTKEVEELTELELLRLENKQLKARNEYLEMENAIEKKLEELRHRYGNIH